MHMAKSLVFIWIMLGQPIHDWSTFLLKGSKKSFFAYIKFHFKVNWFQNGAYEESCSSGTHWGMSKKVTRMLNRLRTTYEDHLREKRQSPWAAVLIFSARCKFHSYLLWCFSVSLPSWNLDFHWGPWGFPRRLKGKPSSQLLSFSLSLHPQLICLCVVYSWEYHMGFLFNKSTTKKSKLLNIWI